MENKIPSYLLHNVLSQDESVNIKRAKFSFLDRTIMNSANALKSIYQQAENASDNNFIRKINPKVKVISLIFAAIVISIVNDPDRQMLITLFIFICYIVARLRILEVYGKIFFISSVFGLLVILPASLNIITPGKIIFNLFTFDRPSHFLIYNIPQKIGVTVNGLLVVLLLFLRVLNSVSFSLLIVYTTSFPSFVKSFKIIGVPDTFLMIISLAYKYIFILSRTIEETYFALKSRLSGNIKSNRIRKLVSGRIFFIFRRSVLIYENTYYAMVSRGYSGKVKLHSKYTFTLRDIIVLFIIIFSGLTVILF